MALVCFEHPDNAVFEMHLTGQASEAEFEAFLQRFEAFIAQNGSVRLVELVATRTARMPSHTAKFRLNYNCLRKVTHAAVVAETGTLGIISRAASQVMPMTMRFFKPDQLEAARTWAANADRPGVTTESFS